MAKARRANCSSSMLQFSSLFYEVQASHRTVVDRLRQQHAQRAQYEADLARQRYIWTSIGSIRTVPFTD